jgi:hypothetical protein
MSSTNATKNATKSQEAARAALMIVGLAKHYATVGSLTIEGATYTPAQLEASLQKLIALRKGVDDAKAAAKARIADERAQAPALRKLMVALATVVKGAFGTSPDVLADFGLAPKKARAPLTVEQRATVAAKRKATRAARHTMGTKQRKKVKGAVSGVVITPVISGVMSTPSASATSTPASDATSQPPAVAAPAPGASAATPAPPTHAP